MCVCVCVCWMGSLRLIDMPLCVFLCGVCSCVSVRLSVPFPPSSLSLSLCVCVLMCPCPSPSLLSLRVCGCVCVHVCAQLDVIDLDPYGTPVQFLDGAGQAVEEGGVSLCERA